MTDLSCLQNFTRSLNMSIADLLAQPTMRGRAIEPNAIAACIDDYFTDGWKARFDVLDSAGVINSQSSERMRGNYSAQELADAAARGRAHMAAEDEARWATLQVRLRAPHACTRTHSTQPAPERTRADIGTHRGERALPWHTRGCLVVFEIIPRAPRATQCEHGVDTELMHCGHAAREGHRRVARRGLARLAAEAATLKDSSTRLLAGWIAGRCIVYK